MRVSRAQAEENRQHVVDTASRLFRQHGYDGIGLKDLMKGAGLTQGAFYKQFGSKEDLIVEASARAMESATARWTRAIGAHPDEALDAVLNFYLSKGHRKETTDGCPLVALGGDAARQGPGVKASFEAGIREHLQILADILDGKEGEHKRAKALTILATMVGAVTLSRAMNDTRLAQSLLDSARSSILELAA